MGQSFGWGGVGGRGNGSSLTPPPAGVGGNLLAAGQLRSG